MKGPLPRSSETGRPSDDPHIPVLIDAIVRECSPVTGVWLDGTLGAGGYTRELLKAGAERVIGVDRDPLASDLDELAGEPLDGVVLDLGVSSMQLDQAERGFSFMKDGPLDMRMSQSGDSAADLVNTADEGVLADILYHYGEERASRRIAHAIVTARAVEPIQTTAKLAEIVAKCLPRPKPGQSHPATRSFQAIRIAVNTEFQELAEGLNAAERALKPGGLLAVVTFHSLEDRIVKRFFQLASGHEANANRYAPAKADTTARFEMVTRKAVAPDEAEIARNPRARSAKLRVGRRTSAPLKTLAPAELGLPEIQKKGRR
jgi:16S rRNA (cytosine1402-N4)-methyltransferase